MKIWAFPSVYPYDFPEHRSRGIFAHRQYKALVKNGVQLSVIQPVSWHPGALLSKLHPEWKQAAELNYPAKRIYDTIQVFHPRVQNLKPSRFFTKTYKQKYVEAIEHFFLSNNIKLSPSDIFFSQWIPEAYNVMYAARKLGVQFAVKIIGDDILVMPKHQAGYTDILREVLTGADIRFTVADYLANEANRLLNTHLVFNTIRRGTDYDFFAPVSAEVKQQYRKDLGIPTDKLVILCVGSAILAKGWLDLFDALKEVKDKGLDFVLAGIHGSMSSLDLVAEAEKRGLKDNFITFNEVVPEKMNRFYNIADIFCLASHSEGIANVVVEAMATGIPVITTNISGHPELVRHMETGIMVDPYQPHALSLQLSALIADKELRDTLGNNARQFIVNEWGNAEYNAEKLYKVFQAHSQNKNH